MRKFLARFRQSPVFSTVYILGAALSVASVMLVAIFLHVKTSNIYPEYSRDKMLYLRFIEVEYDLPNGDDVYHNTTSGALDMKALTLLSDTLKQYCDIGISEADNHVISVYADGKKHHNIIAQGADYSIFNVYDYKFTEGKPFTKEDVTNRAPKVVISDRLARRLFGTDRNVVGRKIITQVREVNYFGTITDDEATLEVCGVFKEGSRLLSQSFAEMIIPSISDVSSVNVDYVGGNKMVLIPKPGVSKEQITEIIRTLLNKLIATQPLEVYQSTWQTKRIVHADGSVSGFGLSVRDVDNTTFLDKGTYRISIGNPHNSLELALGNLKGPYDEFNFAGFAKLYGVLILVLLLVPALNLSSLISGNMDSKMSEMGIRKAFGASNATLLRQVINENLWLTGCGAIIGVILSWLGVVMWKEWLFAGVGSGGGNVSTSDVLLDPAMLFAPKVFIAAIVICVTLNLLSSLIPVWWALRRPAIDAIKSKS